MHASRHVCSHVCGAKANSFLFLLFLLSPSPGVWARTARRKIFFGPVKMWSNEIGQKGQTNFSEPKICFTQAWKPECVPTGVPSSERRFPGFLTIIREKVKAPMSETKRIGKGLSSNPDSHRQPSSRLRACTTETQVPAAAASGHGARPRMRIWYLYGLATKTKLPNVNRFTSDTHVISSFNPCKLSGAGLVSLSGVKYRPSGQGLQTQSWNGRSK